MNLTKNNIKKLAIEHYDRMIHWLKDNEDKLSGKNMDTILENMLLELEESIGVNFCSYCQYSHCDCDKCKLSTDGIKCCDGLWLEMYVSDTIEEFIEKMEIIKSYIELYG